MANTQVIMKVSNLMYFKLSNLKVKVMFNKSESDVIFSCQSWQLDETWINHDTGYNY